MHGDELKSNHILCLLHFQIVLKYVLQNLHNLLTFDFVCFLIDFQRAQFHLFLFQFVQIFLRFVFVLFEFFHLLRLIDLNVISKKKKKKGNRKSMKKIQTGLNENPFVWKCPHLRLRKSKKRELPRTVLISA